MVTKGFRNRMSQRYVSAGKISYMPAILLQPFKFKTDLDYKWDNMKSDHGKSMFTGT